MLHIRYKPYFVEATNAVFFIFQTLQILNNQKMNT